MDKKNSTWSKTKSTSTLDTSSKTNLSIFKTKVKMELSTSDKPAMNLEIKDKKIKFITSTDPSLLKDLEDSASKATTPLPLSLLVLKEILMSNSQSALSPTKLSSTDYAKIPTLSTSIPIWPPWEVLINPSFTVTK